MRVLFLKGLSAWALGGDRTETIRLVDGAKALGGDVALAADTLPKELPGVPHFHVDYPQTPAIDAQTREALSAFKPDLVHVIGSGIRFLQAFDAVLRTSGVPWAFTAHNVPPAEKIFPHLLTRPRLHYAVRNALAWPSVRLWSQFLRRGSFQRVVCHSATVFKRLAARGCDTDKIVDIPFGCDEIVTDESTPSPFPAGASPRVLTVAGFAPHKGQYDAVRAVAKLIPDFPTLAYRMIGNPRPDERYARFVQREVKQLGVDRNVALIENASEPTKLAALRDTDLYLQPSHEEGFCIAFMEAAMVSPRLVGTDTGAMTAIAEGDATARVVPIRDASALARAMRELLKEKVDAAMIERRRTSLRQRYSWERYATQHVDVYRSMLSARTN